MKNALLLGVLLMMSSTYLYGQESQPTIELTEKHQQQLATITDSTKRAKRYQKYFKKDSTSQTKKWLKQQATQTTQQLAQEHLGINELPTDSTAVVNEVKQLGTNELEQQTGVELQEIDFIKRDSTGVSIDSTAVKETITQKGEEFLKNTDEFKALNGDNSELGELTEVKDKIEKTQQELQKMSAQDEMKKQMTSKAKDYILQNAEQIQQVQGQMTELKSKYSAVPNSNDLSTATKRSSLKGEPFWKRFFLGGNFAIPSLDPFVLDLSPQLGYRIDKRFEAGISAMYRVEFKKSDTWSAQKDEKYGMSIFADYLFYKNFFGYLEGEYINTADIENDLSTRSWKETLLIGVGRKFNITKSLQMHALVSFNVLHDNQDGLYNSPVVFKTGFRMKK